MINVTPETRDVNSEIEILRGEFAAEDAALAAWLDDHAAELAEDAADLDRVCLGVLPF